MIALIPVLALAVVAYLWWVKRGSGLTRMCRWRRGASGEAGLAWRCAACGAEMVLSAEGAPRDCLRQR